LLAYGCRHEQDARASGGTEVIKQKIDYIHNNPVKAGFVTKPIQWKYSSARNFNDDHTILEIDDIGFLG